MDTFGINNLQSLTDEQLAGKVTAGQKELFVELVKRYESKLLRYTSYLLKDDTLSYDVVQDTFIKAYQNLKSFNPDRKFSSWIYRIAHNESINKIKKNQHELFNIDFDFLGDLIPQEASPELEFERTEIERIVKGGLEELPIKFKDVLTLYYLEDKSYEEISDILRISVGTVGTWINRGKTKLRKILEDMNKKYY